MASFLKALWNGQRKNKRKKTPKHIVAVLVRKHFQVGVMFTTGGRGFVEAGITGKC